jgi:small multidrug resistance family-3 protein
MGLYIVLFFLTAQAVAVLVFRERLDRSVIAGGSLVVLGGIVMTVFRG